MSAKKKLSLLTILTRPSYTPFVRNHRRMFSVYLGLQDKSVIDSSSSDISPAVLMAVQTVVRVRESSLFVFLSIPLTFEPRFLLLNQESRVQLRDSPEWFGPLDPLIRASSQQLHTASMLAQRRRRSLLDTSHIIRCGLGHNVIRCHNNSKKLAKCRVNHLWSVVCLPK